MELINKIKTVALSGLAVGSGGALYGYYSAPSTTENKIKTKPTKRPLTKPSGPAYETCVKGNESKNIKKQPENVCDWIYRGLVRR